MPTHRARAVLGCVLAGLSMVPVATSAAQTAVLRGYVTSDSARHRVLVGATVEIPALGQSFRTNWAGEYTLTNLRPGKYFVVARADGYKPIGDSVTIQSGGDSFHDFVLFQRVAELAPVTTTTAAPRREYISPALRAFEDRRASGIGKFIPETTLRASDHRRMAEVLSTYTTGLQLLRRNGTTMVFANRAVTRIQPPRGIPRACYVTIYVDGVLRYDLRTMSTTEPPDIDDFAVSDFAGVEFYPGEGSMPNGYVQSGCGLLLLWSREK